MFNRNPKSTSLSQERLHKVDASWRGPPMLAPTKGRTVYACPLHPEMQRDQRGSCPECAAKLEPRTIVSRRSQENRFSLRDMTLRFWISATLTMPIFVLAVLHWIPSIATQSWAYGHDARMMEFLLSTPVVCWGGWPFFHRGWQSILTKRMNMFTLISLGVGAAYLYSAAAMLFPGCFPNTIQDEGGTALYFEAATLIVVLVLLGQVLELRAHRQTGSAIRALLDQAPPSVKKIVSGTDLDVPLDQIQVGDYLRIAPGANVPVDGRVTEGASSVDESVVTGESVPIAKALGDPVTGGTINGSGSFVMRAERVGSDTMLAQITEMVAQAQRSQVPIQGLADSVAEIFTVVVMTISVITFAGWMIAGPEPRFAHALINAISVLVIACPCALGLASPMSILVAVGRGAQEGVLVKNAMTLKRLDKVTTLVLDLTGTLTEGRPKLLDVLPRPGLSAGELLGLAASVELASDHVLAAAIVQGAKDQGILLEPVKDFRSVSSSGVAGTVARRAILVGKLAFLRDEKVTGLEVHEAAAASFQEEGESVAYLAIDGKAAGILVTIDQIKSTAPQAVRDLQSLGLDLVMLTGQSRRTALTLARQLGISSVEADIEPAGKVALVRKLQSDGQKVAMVGDGISDSPALSEADVGIAMGTGTDVAMRCAGITLVRGDLRGIVKAIRLSHATILNIRQNLFFAILYNAMGIPLAAGALYPSFGLLLSPIIAGAAMSLSSVSVIGNALRLRKARLD